MRMYKYVYVDMYVEQYKNVAIVILNNATLQIVLNDSQITTGHCVRK